jgi:hypothetical protein
VEKHREHLDKEAPDTNTSKPFVGEAYNTSNQYSPNIPPWLHPNEIPSWAKGVSNNQPGFGRATGAPNINMMTLHDSLRLILVCLPMIDPSITHSCFDFQGRTMTVNQALNYIYGAIMLIFGAPVALPNPGWLLETPFAQEGISLGCNQGGMLGLYWLLVLYASPTKGLLVLVSGASLSRCSRCFSTACFLCS